MYTGFGQNLGVAGGPGIRVLFRLSPAEVKPFSLEVSIADDCPTM